MSTAYRDALILNKHAILTELGAEIDSSPLGIHEEFMLRSRKELESMKLRLIDAALDRIDAGDFGLCLNCDEPIPERRLEAVPWAKYCVPCQEVVGSVFDRIPSSRLDLALAE